MVCERLTRRPQLLITAMFSLFASSSSHVGAAEPPDGLTAPYGQSPRRLRLAQLAGPRGRPDPFGSLQVDIWKR